MAITMVREPSEQPNITNIDDIIPFRYAYGDQSGYVKGKGTELAYTINGSVFEIGSGRIVLQGVESDIDANGESITVDNVATTRYYVVYYMVNLGTNTVSIGSVYDTAGYPTIDEGDDLTENSSGIARLEIYRFTALSGSISNVSKTIKQIEYTGRALNGYDYSKGTVEERLTNLGFRQSSIIAGEDYTVIENQLFSSIIKRQGNYVLLPRKMVRYDGDATSISDIERFNGMIFRVPNEFRPKEDMTINCYFIRRDNTNFRSTVQLLTNGECWTTFVANLRSFYFEDQLGYEAQPIE